MKNRPVTPSLSIAIAIAAFANLAGCAMGPGSRLPEQMDLAKKAVSIESDGCSVDAEEALRCARYLSNELANVETSTGVWGLNYNIATVAAGTLAAVYLKSSTDRTQALEDLAVGVAALAGLHGVFKVEDRRRIAREGREALDCMIAAAEGIELYAKQAKAAQQAENLLKKKTAAVANARSFLEQKVTSQKDAEKNRSKDPTTFTVKTQDVTSAEQLLHRAQTEESTALTPFKKFDRSVDREFAIKATLDTRGRDLAPRVASPSLERFAAGMLLQAKGQALESSARATASSAIAAQEMMPKILAHGVYQVLNNVRGSLADLSAAPTQLVTTQRDSVNSLIADLKAKADVETDAATKLEGASEVTPVTEDERKDSVKELTDSTKTAAKRQIQSVYQQCVAAAG